MALPYSYYQIYPTTVPVAPGVLTSCNIRITHPHTRTHTHTHTHLLLLARVHVFILFEIGTVLFFF